MGQDSDDSQLFLVRLWADKDDEVGRRGSRAGPAPEGEGTVHGKVQHVLSGKAAPFTNWQALVESLSNMMAHQAGAENNEPFETEGANDNDHNI